MHWKLKAIIQNLVDMLPYNLAYPVYHQIQRTFGALKTIDPIKDFEKSIFILKAITLQNRSISDKNFLEIGTGRTINVPIGLWLCGASKIITVDLNPYLKEELVLESIEYIRQYYDNVKFLFNSFIKEPQFNDRFDKLISTNANLDTLLDLMNIEYLAPADATSLQIKNNSIDFYFSIDVFEHIPPHIIRNVLSEAKRILSKDGLIVHRIDLSDHFSHFDRSITSINFLQFTEKQWNQWAGNRFMYHNRLRACEYYELFEQQGVKILSAEELIDDRSVKLIEKGFCLDNRFIGYSPQELAVYGLNIIGTFSK